MDQKDIWHDDALQRKGVANFLTKYMLSNPEVKVLNLNSPWGSGKTFFLRRWHDELSENHVCIFYDAWENDFSTEPLVALITCIEQATADPIALSSSEAGKKLIDTSSKLIRKAVPLIAKGLMRKYVGIEYDELTSDTAGDISEGIVSGLIEEQAKTQSNINDFKTAVIERLKIAAENFSKKSPAFIFIDELDRCRPTYAIELLERIKHFFEIPDCRFIIASDSKQLAHSIRSVYGEQFNSERYLSRFFDSEFRLDNQDIAGFINIHTPEITSARLGLISSPRRLQQRGHNISSPNLTTITCDIPEFTEEKLLFLAFSRIFKLELREILKCIRQVKAIYDSKPKEIFHLAWAAALVFSKTGNEDIYQELTSKSRDFDKIHKLIGETPQTTVIQGGSIRGVWEIVLFYLDLRKKEPHEFRQLSNSIPDWQSNIYNLVNTQEELDWYIKITELAHRLD